MNNVEAALSVLVNASRVSPILRAAVQAVEDELLRLRSESPAECPECGQPIYHWCDTENLLG